MVLVIEANRTMQSGSTSFGSRGEKSASGKASLGFRSGLANDGKCFNCGIYGHKREDCRKEGGGKSTGQYGKSDSSSVASTGTSRSSDDVEIKTDGEKK